MNWDGSAARRGPAADAGPALGHRPALVRPDDRLPERASRPTRATLLAWGTDPVVPAGDRGPEGPARWPTSCTRSRSRSRSAGKTTFADDLLRSSVLEVGANFFSKDPWALSLGTGRRSAIAYRPIPFEGTFTPRAGRRSRWRFGGDIAVPARQARDALAEKARCEPGSRRLRRRRRTACRTSRSLDVRTGTWVQFAHMAPGQRLRAGDAARWVDPASGEVQVKFVNERQDQASASSSRSAIDGDRPSDRASSRPRASSSATTARSPSRAWTSTSPRARSSASSVPTAPARRRRCGSSPRCSSRTAGDAEIAGASRAPEPQRRPPRPRVHAGLVRGLRRHEGLGVPGLLRALLRHPGRPPAADDRRPARARRPRAPSATPTSRASRAACSSACASPTRSSTTRRCCSSTSRRRASTRGPASSCASCSGSCGRWARRSSSRPTSSPSSRSCARRSRSSTAARSSPTAASPTSRSGSGSARSPRPGPGRRRGARGRAGLVRRPARRRHGGAARGRHDRDRLPRRRRRAPPGCSPTAVGAGPAGRLLRPGRERPRGAVPPGHRPGAGPRRRPSA